MTSSLQYKLNLTLYNVDCPIRYYTKLIGRYMTISGIVPNDKCRIFQRNSFWSCQWKGAEAKFKSESF